MTLVRAAALADVPDGGVLAVEVGGVDVALVRVGDAVHAIRDWCSHAEVPLSEGDVEGCEIECWLHASRFDVRTGAALNLPATEPVPTYQVRLDGDGDTADVLVDVTTSSNTQE